MKSHCDLDEVLHDWERALAGASRVLARNRMLGFPPVALPSVEALAEATLAAVDGKPGLLRRIAPHELALRDKGVLSPGERLAELDVGALLVMARTLPYLAQVANLVASMARRADSAGIGQSVRAAPTIRLPDRIEAPIGTIVKIQLRTSAAARLLLRFSAFETSRTVIQPADQLMLTMTHWPGQLTVYAENDYGTCKVVRDLVWSDQLEAEHV